MCTELPLSVKLVLRLEEGFIRLGRLTPSGLLRPPAGPMTVTGLAARLPVAWPFVDDCDPAVDKLKDWRLLIGTGMPETGLVLTCADDSVMSTAKQGYKEVAQCKVMG